MVSARTISGSAETLLVRIKTLAKEHRARCLVIDPVSTLSKAGNELTAHGVAERLIDWTKADGITLVCTSLLDEMSGQTEGGTPLQISTLADTWIHLNYLVQAGERNRGMSIIKSRGTAHSNQVRELILSDDGVTLADIYTAGGEVLMGTMRWEKESAERFANEVAEVAASSARAPRCRRGRCSKSGQGGPDRAARQAGRKDPARAHQREPPGRAFARAHAHARAARGDAATDIGSG
jgi:circadian clock protein KaiC